MKTSELYLQYLQIIYSIVKYFILEFKMSTYSWCYSSKSVFYFSWPHTVFFGFPKSEITKITSIYKARILLKSQNALKLGWKSDVNSLSNSRRHSANADVIADMKSKIIVSRRHFFADVIFSATSKVQNYQNKTSEKSLNPNKQVLTTNFQGF